MNNPNGMIVGMYSNHKSSKDYVDKLNDVAGRIFSYFNIVLLIFMILFGYVTNKYGHRLETMIFCYACFLGSMIMINTFPKTIGPNLLNLPFAI